MRRLLAAMSLAVIVLTCVPVGGAALASVRASGGTSGSAGSATSSGLSAASMASCATGSTRSRIRCHGLWRHTASSGAQGSGLTATELESIYHVPAATTAGTGPLVAVVDPYHYDAAASDLAAYRSAYGLPACGADGTARPCFREIDEHGGTTFVPEPATDNWSGETALDLQMVSAACPSCRLLLVSASSEQALVTAIAQAVAQGAQYVSMSFGGPARRVSSTLFQQWPDVLFTAAAGDLGYQGADWPNEATHVLAIGGVRDAHGRLSAWNDAYGGTNAGCARPDKAGITPRMPVQQRANNAVWATCGNAHKAETDLSAIADPRTGVANYVEGHWYEAGGTSAAAPIIAGLYADAGNHTDPYAAYANSGIQDVKHGSICVRHVSGRLCRATKGWDGPTGLGMPTSPAALAVAPPAPRLGHAHPVRGRVGQHVAGTIALPSTTRSADGTTVALTSVKAVVRGLPRGLSAHVHRHRIVIGGTAKASGRGHAALYVWGRTPDGRRTEAAAATVAWQVSRSAAPGPR